MAESLIIGSRASRLALWQAERIAERLRAIFPSLDVRIHTVSTFGDRDRSTALAEFGGVGVFVKELERSLLDHEVDVAVHSLKDLPTMLPDGLCVAAVPFREEYRDALCTRSGGTLAELPSRPRVGTGSPRRAAQLRFLRTDIEIVPIRGNVETRIRKLHEEALDGLVLSYAGLCRLSLQSEAAEVFDPEKMLPAPGQGAVAVEARADDRDTLSRLAAIDDSQVRFAVEAERAVLQRLGGGCHLAVGALATVEANRLLLRAVLGRPDGSGVVRAEASGGVAEVEAMVALVASRLSSFG